MAPVWDDTVIVVMTEFGRTARINGNEGTDHGTATTAFLIGGAVLALWGASRGLSALIIALDRMLELEETRGGLESLRWALGGVKVILLSPIGLARLAAFGVVVGVVGGTFPNSEVFMQVRNAGFDSWRPALT